MTQHPLTIIARTLADEMPSVAVITRRVGESLAEWIEQQAQGMKPGDSRVPGFLDLADRLRNQ